MTKFSSPLEKAGTYIISRVDIQDFIHQVFFVEPDAGLGRSLRFCCTEGCLLTNFFTSLLSMTTAFISSGNWKEVIISGIVRESEIFL